MDEILEFANNSEFSTDCSLSLTNRFDINQQLSSPIINRAMHSSPIVNRSCNESFSENSQNLIVEITNLIKNSKKTSNIPVLINAEVSKWRIRVINVVGNHIMDKL